MSVRLRSSAASQLLPHRVPLSAALLVDALHKPYVAVDALRGIDLRVGLPLERPSIRTGR
jgi:hypothetical protein